MRDLQRFCGVLVMFLGVVLLAACGRSASQWTEEGDTLLRANDLEGAEHAYNKALAKDPHYAPAIYGKGWALTVSGFDELEDTARQLFERSIDYDPDFFGGYRGRGVLLLKAGNLQAAETFLRQAYERAPENATVVESMGQLYLRAGHLAPAKQAFTEAVRLAPERGELRRFLADVALAEDDFDGALEQLAQARAGSVSGKRGLYLVEEGEVYVHCAAARAMLDGRFLVQSSSRPSPMEALAAAEAALDRIEALGFIDEATALRRAQTEPLKSAIDRGTQGEDNGGEATTSKVPSTP